MSKTTNPTRTKRFKALVAVLGTEEAAITAWNSTHPERQIEVAEAPKTAKELVDDAIAEAGFSPVRGRVYGNGSLLEAGARVLKTGSTEIVRLGGDFRVKAVCVFKTEAGSVAFQNLGDAVEA